MVFKRCGVFMPVNLLLVLVVVCVVLNGALSTDRCSHTYLPKVTANCSGLGLSRVPWGLHFNISMLDLSNNRWVKIKFTISCLIYRVQGTGGHFYW
jgi:hypothetical protein